MSEWSDEWWNEQDSDHAWQQQQQMEEEQQERQRIKNILFGAGCMFIFFLLSFAYYIKI
tara:strand:+ start:1183 stop:1359 length:177 start_codon:yes stop_codon:yes gene_type:complete